MSPFPGNSNGYISTISHGPITGLATIFRTAKPYPLFTPVPMPEDAVRMKEEQEEIEESHLRSYRAVKGYHIEASDGAIGTMKALTRIFDFALLQYGF